MPKTQSIILGITTISVTLLLLAIPSPDSLAIGPHPPRPSPKLSPSQKQTRIGPPIQKPLNDNDHERLGSTHSDGHLHPPHLHSKKCKDIYGNLVPCRAQADPFR
jgi:hypothetical protein